MFWLSHHPPHEYNRTYVLFGVRVCARCLGTYPTLFLLLGVQIAHRTPLDWPGQVPAVLVLTLPALLDWAWGRFRPQAGVNALRTASGVLLGAALARSLYVHLRRPLPPVLLWQLGMVLAIALPTLFLASRQQRR